MGSVRLVLLGPPGVGKGTQAERIRAEFGLLHLSTGDMLRDAVRRGTDAGLKARPIIERGGLVPDALVGEMVEERLKAPDAARGFLLDGFPRTAEQVGILDGILSRLGMPLDRVLLLSLPEDEILRRLTERRSCPGCGAVYNLSFRPPRRPGICDACGAPVVQRSDDSEEVVRSRLEVYRRQTSPVAEMYRSRGLLAEIDAGGGADSVTETIRLTLQGAGA